MRYLLLVLSISLAGCSVVYKVTGRDHAIVPGERIGPIALGMTATDLYRAMGEPKRVTHVEGFGTWFEFGELSARINDQTQKVSTISVQGGEFATSDGVRIGSSELAVRAAYGGPSAFRNAGNTTSLCYDRGLYVALTNGFVQSIRVGSSGCS
jgi:hypothetical protein